ncbi:response regulator transcription factor [Planomicrobium okeanokoites]|uniref:response regulator transcription factor n=1 Tax=Planomicrobium okeanokoites TaxID=244 RepID=UPI0030F4D026
MNQKNVRPINVLVIEPHPLFREGLKRVLETESRIQIIAEGENGEQLLPMYEEFQPDVVLIELNLPQQSGIDAVKDLTQQFPQAVALIFTVDDSFPNVSQAIQAGAAGYLLKEMDSSSISEAITTAANGGIYLHPKITKDFVSEFNKLSLDENVGAFVQSELTLPYHLLTARETEVLQLLADGYSNKALGEELDISIKTVKNHVSTILRKMGLKDRTQVVVEALKRGWVELR